MIFRSDDISINTLIGAGSAITGNVRGNGFVRIDGDIDGNFETDGNLIIGEKARVRGNITAKAAVICGIVIGDIFAKEGVELLSTSTVIGDIITKSLQVDDRVVLHGRCISISDADSLTEKTTEYMEAKTIRSKAIHK
jgi:cytoskeletal protein CcmA (bactofilin family)